MPPRLHLSLGLSYDVQRFLQYKLLVDGEMQQQYVVGDRGSLLGTRESVNPALGVVYDLLEGLLRLRAAVAAKTRFPTLSEYAKVETEELDVGLKPERSYSINAGPELSLLDDRLTLGSDYFFTVVDDRIVKLGRDEPPTNGDRMVAQGLDGRVQVRVPRFSVVDLLSVSVGYTFLHARNRDYNPGRTVNKGAYVEFTPEHSLFASAAVDFVSGTGVMLWSSVRLNQRVYVMQSRPETLDTPYSTDFYTTVWLHDPVMLNFKLSQRLWDDYAVSFTIKNLLDDYDANPFDPGPGRTFWFSLGARWEP